MDPLVAAQVYNNRFCPLVSRLPEELLLCILDCLSNDVVTLLCLRVVSRVFLRLLKNQPVPWLQSFTPQTFDLRLQFRRLLSKDGRCDHCRRWNESSKYQLFDDCKFQQKSRQSPDGTFDPLLYARLYCYACHSFHDICQFSSTYQRSSGPQPQRRCLGQQGSVQLCAHIQITWASIQSHIVGWRQQQCEGVDWRACLDSFSIECHDVSHDTRCTASETPTWPRARLGTSCCDSDSVVLNLEWTPHNRMDGLALTADGRIPAPELRVLFRRLRSLGPADTLCPVTRHNALPEMALFRPASYAGQLVYHKMGEDDEIRSPPVSYPRLLSGSSLMSFDGHGIGHNGKRLDIRSHYLKDVPRDVLGTGISSQCLIINYEKDIMICKTTALTDPAIKIIPTDHWLHAMDTQTYPHPQATHIRPQCREIACVNYYRRRQDFYICSNWLDGDSNNGQTSDILENVGEDIVLSKHSRRSYR